MKQKRGLGIISFGRHHQLGYADIRRRLDWFTGRQSLVETDAATSFEMVYEMATSRPVSI
jgi:hypothetical protein